MGFEPTPFRNGALSHRLRPLGQTVLLAKDDRKARGEGETMGSVALAAARANGLPVAGQTKRTCHQRAPNNGLGCLVQRAHGYIAQWLERLTADQQVPGSNPGVPSCITGNWH